jgi:hypothetical protein
MAWCVMKYRCYEAMTFITTFPETLGSNSITFSSPYETLDDIRWDLRFSGLWRPVVLQRGGSKALRNVGILSQHHGVTSQKTSTWIFTAVKTSNVATYTLMLEMCIFNVAKLRFPCWTPLAWSSFRMTGYGYLNLILLSWTSGGNEVSWKQM